MLKFGTNVSDFEIRILISIGNECLVRFLGSNGIATWAGW